MTAIISQYNKTIPT
jgi:hypothetical protein